MTFGDWDPEDGYDADDPPARRLTVIARILDDLAASPDDARFAVRLAGVRRLLERF